MDVLLNILQIVTTIITVGVTLFNTVAKPIKNFSAKLAESNMQQIETNAALKDVTSNLRELISENRAEHAEFREMLVDHEKRIYKMEG